MIDNHLKIIDFSEAIRQAPLNFNYQVIKGWVDRERLRLGGYGLCEGFDLSYDGNFGVTIGEGCLINHYGEEVMTPEYKIVFDAPPYETITETVTVGEEGKIILKYAPYSPSLQGLIVLNAEHSQDYEQDELQILEPASSVIAAYPIRIDGKTVTVSDRLVGQNVDIKYFYCDDRIDAIMIDEEAVFYYEQGINATSPSAADIDLKGRFLIAFVHWIISETIDVEFIIDDRTYRRVYVDHYNRLYLNGKFYKESKFIYFVEPENPEENDVWYDIDNNVLCVWEKTGGVWGWRIMNDFTNVPLRSFRAWIPQTEEEKATGKSITRKNFPADAQTFLFDEDETNLRYIPGTNAIEIIIDQQLVMSDQFTEIIQPGTKEYLSSGIGFKLNEPLDRETVVQCIIHHTVKNAPLKNVFQRAAIFIDENFHAYSGTNTEQIFQTELPYVIGADQLEVFIDGSRLNKEDFSEMTNSRNIATSSDNDKTTLYFKVKKSLQEGQIVTYKISRYVWSYDQLNSMMEEIESKANQGISDCEKLQMEITNLSGNMNDVLDSLKQRLDKAEARLKELEDVRTSDKKIEMNDLDADVRSSLVRSQGQYMFNASNTDNEIPDCTEKDCVFIICLNPDEVVPLIPGQDYTLSYENDQAAIDLESEWMSPDNNLFVNVIRIGR